MKKIEIIKIIIFMCMVLLPIKTEAALSVKDFEIECVYDNGVSITIYNSNDSYGMSITPFKLSNAETPPYSNSLSFFFKEDVNAEKILKNMTCPDSIQSALMEQKSKSGDTETSMQFEVLFHNDDGETLMTVDSSKTTNFVAGFNPTSGRIVPVTVRSDSILGKRVYWYWDSDETGTKKAASFYFKLVSEKIYFNNDVSPNRQWAFKSEGAQAASNPTYIRVYEYTNPAGNKTFLAEKGNTVTKLSISSLNTHVDEKVMFVCFNPSVKEIDTTKNEAAYKFSSVRHAIQYKGTKDVSSVVEGSNGYSCNTGYSLYREVDWAEAEEAEDDATSICDVIPETSLLIAKVINYSRILVPIFLIILTAVDITKIILTGDINEELPKRRKLIIIRVVVAVAFFFIPIFIQVFVSSSYGVDFGDISCLW